HVFHEIAKDRCACEILGLIRKKIPNTYCRKRSLKAEKSYERAGFLYREERGEAIFYQLVKIPSTEEITL
ncbi:hypothetical protein, partial [Klebsiella michiganensis]|uniref:hypothetical protein n=1 Tax=Klebsiella michiganensis TaxID=1134687 RepID=UPI001CA4A824